MQTYLICHIYTFSEYDKNSTQSPAPHKTGNSGAKQGEKNYDKNTFHLPRQYVIIWGQMPMIIIPA